MFLRSLAIGALAASALVASGANANPDLNDAIKQFMDQVRSQFR